MGPVYTSPHVAATAALRDLEQVLSGLQVASDPSGSSMQWGHPDVVVVDDEPLIVTIVCDILDDAGVPTEGCYPSRTAQTCIRAKQPRVIILDVQMPEIDGIQLFQQLRADPETATTPVIFLTANAHILMKRLPDYQARGALLLSKPFKMDALLAVVRQALAG